MKRKLYLDIALLVVILGGFGVFVFMQHAPATDIPTQEAATGCCGSASKVDGGCCGTPTTETAKSDNVLQPVQTQEMPEIDKAATQKPPSDKVDTGGCGCGS